MMTKLFERKPHPARRARIATAGISSTAFLMIISSFAWNTHAAELAANSTTLLPESPAVPATTATDAALPVVPAVPATPAPTVATAPATTTPAPAATPAKKKKKKAVAATPAAAPAAPATQAVTPAAPAAPTVVYTCKSPGGKTENPTSNGTCKNAKYGYVLTQI